MSILKAARDITALDVEELLESVNMCVEMYLTTRSTDPESLLSSLRHYVDACAAVTQIRVLAQHLIAEGCERAGKVYLDSAERQEARILKHYANSALYARLKGD